MTRRDALLLTGSIGRGHHMMAAACDEGLRGDGWQTRTRDSVRLLGPVNGRISERLTKRLMATRGLHDALHFAHLRTGSPLALRMAALSGRQLVPALRTELEGHPAELVLSVFATGAAAAAALKAENPDRRTVVLCTDACPHRLWVWPGTDLFLVTSRAAEANVRRFQPEARIHIVPGPVRAQFFAAPQRPDARDQLGLPAGEPCVLLLDSGWDFGPRLEAARRLAARGVHVLAVAGREPGPGWVALAQQPRVHVFGVSDQVPTLMAAADLVVALPGATICSEARALGRPLLLIDLMPGHGRDNLQQQLDLGNAWVCDATAEGMTAAVLAAFERGLRSGERQAAHAWPDALRTALAGIGLGAPGIASTDADGIMDATKGVRQ